MPCTTPRLSSYPPLKTVLGFSLAVVIIATSEGTFPVKNENLTNLANFKYFIMHAQLAIYDQL